MLLPIHFVVSHVVSVFLLINFIIYVQLKIPTTTKLDPQYPYNHLPHSDLCSFPFRSQSAAPIATKKDAEVPQAFPGSARSYALSRPFSDTSFFESIAAGY